MTFRKRRRMLRLKRTMVPLLIGLLGGLLGALLLQPTRVYAQDMIGNFKTLKTKRLAIVGDNDQEIVVIGAEDSAHGGYLSIHDSTGKKLFNIWSYGAGQMCARFYDAAGKRTIEMISRSDAPPRLSFFDKGGRELQGMPDAPPAPAPEP